ncbi:hypothetical protein ABXN37_08520 [Piscinibacter sakaiensis]|uniref:class I SAM-dependent DNA methyltransferase n=1 Tax=Piscinibacter sakaiensis TaxID=1547922 RepID=UPI003726A039
MLRHAAAGKGYDELHQAELGAFLAQRRADLDAVVAADVMSYFGELDGVMQALATALRPGGVVVLTFEALDEPAAAGFALRSHGRYAHQAAYVCAAALHHGLVVQRLAREVLRSELGRPIASWAARHRRTGGTMRAAPRRRAWASRAARAPRCAAPSAWCPSPACRRR